MNIHIDEGEGSPKVRCFACTGAILGAVLGGAALGFPGVIASAIGLGFVGWILAPISRPERARGRPFSRPKGAARQIIPLIPRFEPGME